MYDKFRVCNANLPIPLDIIAIAPQFFHSSATILLVIWYATKVNLLNDNTYRCDSGNHNYVFLPTNRALCALNWENLDLFHEESVSGTSSGSSSRINSTRSLPQVFEMLSRPQCAIQIFLGVTYNIYTVYYIYKWIPAPITLLLLVHVHAG